MHIYIWQNNHLWFVLDYNNIVDFHITSFEVLIVGGPWYLDDNNN